MSMDAGAFGARLGPEDAYRFARGEELTSSTGLKVKLDRPLDFLVVADHSDNMGFFPRLYAGDPEMLADPTGKKWYEMIQAGGQEGVKAATEIIIAFSQGTFPEKLKSLPGSSAYRSAWEETIEAAEKYNDPGGFTAFIGYEWTSNTGGNNLHRVVIFRDDADKAGRVEPYTTLKPLGSDNPRDLWKWLNDYQDKTGGRVLAIAHNGNLSNGIMFPIVESFTGKPMDPEYARTRAKWEPLYEATQIKGDGETHPFLSPNDEFAKPGPQRFEGAGHAPIRVCPQRPTNWPAARKRAWRQPVQVRHDRIHRQPHGPCHGRRGQLLRQALGRGTRAEALGAPHGPDR
jgi:hypothetical protein